MANSTSSNSTHSTAPKQPSSRAVFWLVLIAILLMASTMRAPIVALGAIAPVVQDALDLSATHIGWLGAIPMLMFALGALISPPIGKKFGLENTLIVVALVLTSGLLIRSWWVGWTGFFIGTFIMSLAIGFANTLIAPVIKQRTPGHIALITGLFSLTMSVMSGLISGVIYPLTEQVGWQMALGSWSVLGILAMIAWVVLRLKVGSSHKVPEALDATIIETAEISVWRAPLAWHLAIFMGLQSLLFYTVAAFLPSIWISKGLTEVQSGNMGSVYQLMAPIAIISMTWLIRRGISIQAVALACALLNVAGTLGILYFSPNLATIWTAAIGLGSAGIFTLCIMLFSMRTYSPHQASKLSGMAQTIAYLIAFAGPFGTGWLIAQTQDWNVPLLLIFILMIVNVVFGWLASRPIMIDGKPV
ncbi:MFS transporter [Psychrobacter lutiphocae]|uniref:MFS transporter n=1 Tax=Psychrobacter lutiphocae TaxID=540500 RepID=UPI000476CA60|nr:MFS transporter [Psychrobacter lutiphocae]